MTKATGTQVLYRFLLVIIIAIVGFIYALGRKFDNSSDKTATDQTTSDSNYNQEDAPFHPEKLAEAAGATLNSPNYVDIEKADLPLTLRAYRAFTSHCPGLSKLAPLIRDVTVRDEAFTLADGARSRSWTIAISVEVAFRRQATARAYQLGIPLMNDYLFLVGSGKAPGILAMASNGLNLCIPNYSTDFLPTPEVNYLRAWPSDVAYNRSHPHQHLDSSVYPLGEGPPIPAPAPSKAR